jgi:hypothetical protein
LTWAADWETERQCAVKRHCRADPLLQQGKKGERQTQTSILNWENMAIMNDAARDS